MGSTYFTQGLIGPESTIGTAVAGTRRLQRKIVPKDDRTRKFVEQARAMFPGPNLVMDFGYQSSWRYSAPVEPNEWAYWLASCFGDGVITDVDSGGGVTDLHTFTEATTAAPTDPQSLTIYTGDEVAAGQIRAAGCAATKLVLRFAGLQEVMGEVELLGRNIEVNDFDVVAFPTVASTDILKSPLSKVFIDTSGAGLGGTQITGTIYEATFTYNTGIGPDRTLDGSLDMTGFTRESPTGTLELLAKWNTNMVNQFTNHIAVDGTRARQFIRVQSEGKIVTSTFPYRIRVDGSYEVMEFDVLSEERNGFNLVKATYNLADDLTWAKRLVITSQGSLAAY